MVAEGHSRQPETKMGTKIKISKVKQNIQRGCLWAASFSIGIVSGRSFLLISFSNLLPLASITIYGGLRKKREYYIIVRIVNYFRGDIMARLSDIIEPFEDADK